MSGPDPTWNDPDWPDTLGGWIAALLMFVLLVGSILAFAFLIAVVS